MYEVSERIFRCAFTGQERAFTAQADINRLIPETLNNSDQCRQCTAVYFSSAKMPKGCYKNSAQVAPSRIQVFSSWENVCIHSTSAAGSNTDFMQSTLLVKILCQGEFPCSRLQNAPPTPLYFR